MEIGTLGGLRVAVAVAVAAAAAAAAAAVADSIEEPAVAKLVTGIFLVLIRPADGGLLLPWLNSRSVEL